MTLFDTYARPREDLPGTGKWRPDVSLAGVRPSAGSPAATQSTATTTPGDITQAPADVATPSNRNRFISDLMLVTKHSTPAGLGQLFDLWVIKASNAKDTPEGVIRWNVEDAGTNSACYQAMDEIAPHNHIAKPGDTLDVAQTHVGAEIGAQVTISHYRRGDNCGNAVTIIASANKAQAA